MVQVKTTTARKWRPDEIHYLMRNYYQQDAKTIAAKLGRTVNSVESKVADLRRKNQFSHAAKLADGPKKETIGITSPVEEITPLTPVVLPKKNWFQRLLEKLGW